MGDQGKDRDGRSRGLAKREKEGFGQTPEHILLAKRHEPNSVHQVGPSFPCQDPILASGDIELGEANLCFKGGRRLFKRDQLGCSSDRKTPCKR